jgi:hypothetical protein
MPRDVPTSNAPLRRRYDGIDATLVEHGVHAGETVDLSLSAQAMGIEGRVRIAAAAWREIAALEAQQHGVRSAGPTWRLLLALRCCISQLTDGATVHFTVARSDTLAALGRRGGVTLEAHAHDHDDERQIDVRLAASTAV